LTGTLALRAVQWIAANLQALGGHAGHLVLDGQGALTWLPGTQIALTAGLLIALRRDTRWTRAAWGFATMMLLTVALFILYGELHVHEDFSLHVRWIRAWAIIGPVLLAWLAHRRSATAAEATPDGSPEAQRYRSFWANVGRDFPSLSGAVSTQYYFDNERRLFEDYFGDLRGQRIFKTDLWDEAKNTRILRWAAEQGAEAFGADISPPITAQACRGFPAGGLRGVVADVRALPFRDGSFDGVYSMGTVEHFDETEQAMGETFRIVRPGGRVIMGVPNRHDPFLRPLMVAVLYRLGLYGYGFEKSYSRKTLHQMLERCGFVIRDETSILFIPGWLRMLELAGHAWFRPLAWLLGWCVRPFRWADRHIPWVRRHGYLLATVADRPAQEEGDRRESG
jgi:SAM-dependent methyltransferase